MGFRLLHAGWWCDFRNETHAVPARASILVGVLDMKADRVKNVPRPSIEPVEPRLLLATTVLSFGDGGAHGAIQVTVDAYGAFGVNTGAGDALYTPPNGQAVGTVFESAVYFAPADRFLSSVGIGGIENLPEIGFDEVGLFATSTFVVGGFHVF